MNQENNWRHFTMETFYAVMRRHGISQVLIKPTATLLGLAPPFVRQIAHPMKANPHY
ncbi:MAG: hypothetical protein KKD09_09465 [Gammaproteobacteria bacterium]|nr:hypothetical protein [Gammaproteobacteria bacterium]